MTNLTFPCGCVQKYNYKENRFEFIECCDEHWEILYGLQKELENEM